MLHPGLVTHLTQASRTLLVQLTSGKRTGVASPGVKREPDKGCTGAVALPPGRLREVPNMSITSPPPAESPPGGPVTFEKIMGLGPGAMMIVSVTAWEVGLAGGRREWLALKSPVSCATRVRVKVHVVGGLDLHPYTASSPT